MRQRDHSQTAVGAAILRAAHQVLDDPKIVDDPVAVGLVPGSTREEILAAMPLPGSRIRGLGCRQSQYPRGQQIAYGGPRGRQLNVDDSLGRSRAANSGGCSRVAPMVHITAPKKTAAPR